MPSTRTWRDLIFWGAAQIGAWGRLAHRASAFAAEAGWQPKTILAPWIRGGFDYGSGTMTRTIRATELSFRCCDPSTVCAFSVLRPDEQCGWLRRADAQTGTRPDDPHRCPRPAARQWQRPLVQGGGAYQPATFGYVGQPVNGNRRLATLLDASADVTVTPRVTVTGNTATRWRFRLFGSISHEQSRGVRISRVVRTVLIAPTGADRRTGLSPSIERHPGARSS